MKKFSRKGVLLFAGAMAVCAFAVPSMASAASWAVVGSEHTLDSANAAFTIAASGTSSSCGESQFTLNVASAAVVEITAVSFRRCTSSGPALGSCTQTSQATGLPWTATAPAINNIQIHGINIDVFLENEPGSTACTAAGVNIRLTGTLTGGGYNNTSHHLTLNGATGLSSHSALGNGQPITANGTFRDTQQTLLVN